MTSDKAKTLWGQDFRVVAQGLAETDVVIFIEKLMREHREKLKQLDHIASLHELATKTVQDAERIANTLLEDTKRDVEAQSSLIIKEAKTRAGELLQDAETAAHSYDEAARKEVTQARAQYLSKARQRLADIEGAINDVKDAAIDELSSRMPSHYIGKHLSQSIQFLAAFDSLVEHLNKGLSEQEQGPPPMLDTGPPQPNSQSHEP